MDAHTTPCRPPAAVTVARRAGAALLLATLWASGWAPPAAAQSGPDAVVRRPDGRVDGVCGASCSADPFEPAYDADCFSCDVLEPPAPKRACAGAGPCEIHEGIVRMGAMVEAGRYDDRTMREVVLAYWRGSAWDVAASWGASALDGYVAYAVVRAALRFDAELDRHPTTRMATACMLRDHAGRGVPTEAGTGRRRFHGAADPWNSWSEDFMGFALGAAAADAWLRTRDTAGGYHDEYREMVGEAVEWAFSATADGGPVTLTVGSDPDPANPGPGPSVMLRNHAEYSPVYAMAILKHVADLNAVAREAGLPPYVTCATKPATFDALYRWVLTKVEPNPAGPGYVFRTDGCQRWDGVMSYCDDRPGDPAGGSGDQREPGHYPLAWSLPELCVAGGLEAVSAECGWTGPAGLEQAPHNYVYNCVFADDAVTAATR